MDRIFRGGASPIRDLGSGDFELDAGQGCL